MQDEKIKELELRIRNLENLVFGKIESSGSSIFLYPMQEYERERMIKLLKGE